MIDLQPLWLSFRLSLVTTAILLLIAIPLAYWLAYDRHRWKVAAEALFTLYYLRGVRNTYNNYITATAHPINWKKSLLLPLQNASYVAEEQRNRLPYKILRPGVKIYLEDDSTHFCINADLPCMSENLPEIEMRDTSVEEGFRVIR